MGGKHDLPGNPRHGPVKSRFPLPACGCECASRYGKPAVAFVQVKYARRDAHGFERTEAAYAEQQLLPDASARITAIEARGQLAVVG